MAVLQVANDGPVYSLDSNSENDAVVIAGKSMIKVYNLDPETGFTEKINLKPSKSFNNLNYSCIDVAWSRQDENLIASAAANGAIVLWNLAKAGRSKQEHVFTEHKRTVNKVTFHPVEPSWLLSGSHEGIVKLLDIRSHESVSQFFSNTDGVRDVQFNPFNTHSFASVSDNGRVQLWDLRKTDKCEKQWPAHDGYVFGCDWHPEARNTLATAGRDKSIKVWNTGLAKASCEYYISTFGPIGRVKWRPRNKNQLASAPLSPVDFNIYLWDIRRPYLPHAIIDYHKDTATSILWKENDPNFILSASKDGFLCLHNFETAHRPADKANPVGISISTYGQISHAFPDKKLLSKTAINSSQPITSSNNGPKIGGIFKKPSAQALGGGGVDDFFVPKSKLRIYENDVTTEDPLEVTGMNYFLTSAREYLLSGDSLDKLCDHNSSVAQSLSRDHVAQTWLSLKILFKCNLFNEKDARSGDGGAKNDGEHSPETDHDRPPLNETRTRHYSSGSSFQNSRSSGNPVGLSNLSRGNPGLSRGGSGGGNDRFNSGGYSNNHYNSEEDSNSEDDNEESYEKTLSNIASGQKLSGDFFGDSEFSSLCVDQLIAVDNSYKSDMIDWTMSSEAFDPRHDMKASSTNHAEAEEYLQQQQHQDEAGQEPGSGGDAPPVLLPGGSKTDDSLEYLKVDTLSLFPVWSPQPIVKETLEFYAERGDVQTVVSIYLVLGHERIGGLIKEATLENWFSAYIELLHQFRMFNKATEIINLCSFQPSIYQMSHQSTTYLINCTNCSKALNRNPMWCNRCTSFPNLCAVCHGVVKGLFAWCQGCGHGGHIEHLSKWLENNTLCPTGCGHHCEYH